MFVFGLFSGGNCKAFLPLCFCVCFHLVFSVVIVFVFGTMCLELYLVGIFRCWVQQARPCLVATADLIICTYICVCICICICICIYICIYICVCICIFIVFGWNFQVGAAG